MLSISDTGPSAPCPAPFNMAAHVLAAGRHTPDKDALLILSQADVERWSYGALQDAILGTATGLLRQGLAPGDIVLMRLGNTVDFPLAYLGALAAGLVPVPTSAALSERETALIIDSLKPAAILHDGLAPCPAHDTRISQTQLHGFRALPTAQIHFGDPERLGYIVYTSGTAGVPLAVAHAHRAIWARRMMFDGWYDLQEDDSVLHAGAFNWTYTLGTGLMDPWTKGATALIPASGTPIEALPGLMRQHHASIFAAAPGVYRQMLDRCPDLDMPSLRHGLSAGEKLPRATADSWRAATGCEIYEAFGMSECSTFISHCPGASPGASPDPTTLGTPQTGRRIALLRDGEPVARGTEGTLAVCRRDPGLMLHYLGAQEATAARMVGEWFLTGDQAVMDEAGQITYLGRDDDMMNAGGYRVSPVEVEHVLSRFPGVTQIATTEVEIKDDTHVIAAFYTGPARLDEAHLQAYVTGKLARYKQPRLYIHLPELPMGANGKIQRRLLRDRFERPL